MATETDATASSPDEAAPVVSEAYPVDTLRAAIPLLRRPFTPEAIRFKVQTVFKDAKGCLVVAYIDARLVIERLNLVCPDLWVVKYEPTTTPNVSWCHLTIGTCDVTRSDVGEGQGRTEGQKAKATVSDALKRAAVHFGVGVSVYALPQITLWASQPHVEKKGTSLALTELGHTKLREGYAKWLDAHGRRLFGEPLDHGDVEGATFDEEDAEPEFTPEPPLPLADESAKMFQAQIRTKYDAIKRIDPQRVPPAQFNGWLSGAAHSHAELEKLRDHLAGVLDGMQGDAT